MAKKILITGASGFVGKNLIIPLLEKDSVEIYATYLSDNSKKEFESMSSKINAIKIDLMNADYVLDEFRKINPDEVYHLAALSSAKQSFDEPEKVVVNNVISELNILESLRKIESKSKILIVSSAEIYGIVDKNDLPIDEETPFKPSNPYAVSKLTQDFLGLQYNIAYGLNVIRVRPFNHIGPGQTDKFVASSFAKKIAEIEKGKIPPVIKVGNLDSKRDFTDVRDMVRAYIMLIEKGKIGDVYNIGSEKSVKIEEVLRILLSFSTIDIKVEVDKSLLRPSDNPELISNNSKIYKIIDWKPEIPLEKTLQDILEYWRKEI